MLNPLNYKEIVELALKEDIGNGDVTTAATVSRKRKINGCFIAREPGIVCGMDVMRYVFGCVDQDILLEVLADDGTRVEKDDVIARISGPAGSVLRGERTALNFLQRMSGIASRTKVFTSLLDGMKTTVVDTRKTTPGHRFLDKYAVKCGGGRNHRFNLSDGVLIKDNHIVSAGSITEAVKRSRERAPHTVRIEVETETLSQVREALQAGADIIMLDNMEIEDMAVAVKIVNGEALIEASGNMAGKDIVKVAETGVDFISIGALTHSVKSLDISLKF